MATSISVCAVCGHQHQTIQSTHWCIECEEPLCTGCKEHHNVLKATRNHKTIPISDYQLLPSTVTDIKHNCVYHNEICQLYCINHESPICNKCVKDHGKCGEVLSLEEVIKDIKTSESFVDIEQSLDDLLTNINLIRTNRELNIKSITDQKKTIAAEVCHLKQQVIQHVSKLEEEFIKELDQIECDCCNPIHSIVSSLQNTAKEINEMKSDIQNTKKYASNLQTFLSMRGFEAKTTEYENHLQSSIDNEYQVEITINSVLDTKIRDILSVDRFGSMDVKKSPSSNVALKRRKDRKAQIMVSKAIKSINDVKPELKRKVNTTCEYSPGVCVTRNGEIIVINHKQNNDKVVAINAKSIFDYTIPLKEPYSAYGVAFLDDDTVAISTGYTKQMNGCSIIDLTKRKVIKFIDLPGYPYGISYDGKSLICCVQDKDLHVISCTECSITTIPGTISSRFSNVSTHSDKIFFTNPETCTVTCCSYSGDLVWKFKDPVLDHPQGITVDINGNVFVAGMLSCNVVGISPDGKQCKQILTNEDGLGNPIAIFFDKERWQLLITNQEGFVLVYDISYS